MYTLLVRNLNSATKCVQRTGSSAPPAIVITSIVDTLCYCVNNHSYRIKVYILKNAVLQKVLQLTKRKQAPLALCAIRMLRTCIGTKEEFYYSQVIKVCCNVRERPQSPLSRCENGGASVANLANARNLFDPVLVDSVERTK